MCGLAGVLDTRCASPREELLGAVRRMTAALEHRGPDGSGEWCDEQHGVALAHRRLAILDLTTHGDQPMLSGDGRYVLAFNGEIYNYVELRDELRSHPFRGTGDTEVLLAAIAEWGIEGGLNRLNGMFAFALWDREERQLTLARDRLGEKPLYFARQGATVVFASELGALRQHPAMTWELDNDGLKEFLQSTFIPSPGSILADVERLRPGHYITVNGAAGGAQACYWSLPEIAARNSAKRHSLTGVELVDEAERLLRDSVRLRLASDVPIGAFLSGGIDSALVVALMQEQSVERVPTFTVSFEGAPDDEASAAADIARHLGTDHTTISLRERDALDLVPRVGRLYDEPFADPSQVPVALMCETARRFVTVCLSGDGGDEVFAGYNRYLLAHGLVGRARRQPVVMRRVAADLLDRVPDAAWSTLGELLRRGGTAGSRLYRPDLTTKTRKLSRALRADTELDAYLALAEQPGASLLTAERRALGTSERRSRSASATRGLSALDSMMLQDQLVTLPDGMLTKLDRASMAASLECRVPLLDHRLVEWSWGLHERDKAAGGVGKILLRKVLDRHVPRRLLERPKLGFDPPIARWLRGPLQDWAGDLLTAPRLRRQGILDAARVQTLWTEHRGGLRDHGYLLWSLLMLQTWLGDT